MKVNKIIASIGLISIIATSSVISLPQSANAYHKTNKSERKANLEQGWTVFYSTEISHREMLTIASAIASDSTITAGQATTAYFRSFALQSLEQIMQEVRTKYPALADNFQKELTAEKLLSSIRASFNGNEVKMSIAGKTIAIGKETYNRAECSKFFGREKCISTPNTHQPYIRVSK